VIRALEVDGYRAFPARRQFDRSLPFQRLELAPLTLLLGRNNSGKTSLAALLLQVLAGLGQDREDILPLRLGGLTLAHSFLDMLHCRSVDSPLELGVELQVGGEVHRLDALLIGPGGFDLQGKPRLLRWSWDGQPAPMGKAQGGGWGEVMGQGLSLPASSMGGGAPAVGLLGPLPSRARIQEQAGVVMRNSLWLGPTRQPLDGLVMLGDRPGLAQMGIQGEGAAALLQADPDLFERVNRWLRREAGISLSWETTYAYQRLLGRRQGLSAVPIEQMGAGIHQLLPVVIRALLQARGGPEEGFIDVVQQPELHLHDALQPALGDLYLHAASAGRGVTLVETHAEGLVLRVRRRVAEGLPAHRVALYFVDDGPEGSILRRIPLRPDGEVEGWPAGVFLESFEEVKALRRAQRARERA
jgi:hypothetical protein